MKNNLERRRPVACFTPYRVLMLTIWLVFMLELLLLWPGGAFAAESDYAEPWCERMGGRAEVVLPDRSRVDCLLAEHAVEVDYARKWAEAMGQALHYARMTGRLPGIMLILEKPDDERYVTRLYADADAWGIPLFIWTVSFAPDSEQPLEAKLKL